MYDCIFSHWLQYENPATFQEYCGVSLMAVFLNGRAVIPFEGQVVARWKMMYTFPRTTWNHSQNLRLDKVSDKPKAHGVGFVQVVAESGLILNFR